MALFNKTPSEKVLKEIKKKFFVHFLSGEIITIISFALVVNFSYEINKEKAFLVLLGIADIVCDKKDLEHEEKTTVFHSIWS